MKLLRPPAISFVLVIVLLAVFLMSDTCFSANDGPVDLKASLSAEHVDTSKNLQKNQSIKRPLWGALTILSVFSGMLFLPFWPGLRESRRPQDEYPLPIEMEYSKDPRYMGKSSRRIFLKGLEDDLAETGVKTIRMSKDEVVEIKKSRDIPSGQKIEHTLFIHGKLRTGDDVTVANDLYVVGTAHIGKGNSIRTLACDGDVCLDSGSRLLRWLDAEGRVEVKDGCSLGISCSCADTLKVADMVEFKRLFAKRIITAGFVDRLINAESGPPGFRTASGQIKNIEDTACLFKDDLSLPANELIEGDLIVKGDLVLREGVAIKGSVRAHGSTTVGKGSVVHGDIFSEGPIDIHEDAVVFGNIFSQASVRAAEGVRVGKNGSVKSLIGKKEVLLAGNVEINGYVLTEGEGVVACRRFS